MMSEPNEAMIEALQLAATTFRRYESLHAAKGSVEADGKARANCILAEKMEAALAPDFRRAAQTDALQDARDVLALRIEGDSDSPLRVAEANAILAGERDEQYAELKAMTAPTDAVEAVARAMFRAEHPTGDCAKWGNSGVWRDRAKAALAAMPAHGRDGEVERLWSRLSCFQSTDRTFMKIGKADFLAALSPTIMEEGV